MRATGAKAVPGGLAFGGAEGGEGAAPAEGVGEKKTAGLWKKSLKYVKTATVFGSKPETAVASAGGFLADPKCSAICGGEQVGQGEEGRRHGARARRPERDQVRADASAVCEAPHASTVGEGRHTSAFREAPHASAVREGPIAPPTPPCCRPPRARDPRASISCASTSRARTDDRHVRGESAHRRARGFGQRDSLGLGPRAPRGNAGRLARQGEPAPAGDQRHEVAAKAGWSPWTPAIAR